MAHEDLSERFERNRALRLEEQRIAESKSPKEKMSDRLEELKSIYTENEQKLQRLNEERAKTEETQLRVQGAIKILTEEIAKMDQAPL